MSDYKVHPLAQMIPMMSERDYQELKNDIKKNGQLNPIIILNDLLIDGRHRLRACVELGIAPKIERNSNSGRNSVADYIWAANVARRHLTDGQRAALKTAWLPAIEAEAKEAQTRKSVLANSPKQKKESVHTREAVAKSANVSLHTARQAIEVAKKAPEMIPKVISGEVKLKDAVKVAEVVFSSPPKSIPTRPTKAQTGIIDVTPDEPGFRTLHFTADSTRPRRGLLAVELIERLREKHINLFDADDNSVSFSSKKNSPFSMAVTIGTKVEK